MTQQKTKLYGLILAGGFSKRMGQDKAFLDFHGLPQIEHVHHLLGKYCSKVYLSKRPNQKPYKRILSIDDEAPFTNIGPLGGILSAMQGNPNVSWLVLACDLPFVDDAALKTLIANRNSFKFATAFISTHDGLPEPLCAIWEKQAYATIIKSFNEGTQCPRKLLIKNDSFLIPQGQPFWLENVNTPEEFKKTATLLRK